MNFALRIILTQDEGRTSVQSIGKSYNYIARDRNPTEFRRTAETLLNPEEEKIYGFLVFDNGETIRPLYYGQEAYIMTEEGKTFDNLTSFEDRLFMSNNKTTEHKKANHEEEVLMEMLAMCEESLDPKTFEKWEDVKAALQRNRQALK